MEDFKLEDVCEHILKKIASRQNGDYNELYPYFTQENGELLINNDIDPKRVVSIFENYRLSKPLDNEKCELTELGIEIGKGIGFKTYVSNLNQTETDKLEKENNRQKLSDEIDRLTILNLKLQNKQMKRYILYSVIAFILGTIITNVKDILVLLKIMNPE